MSQSATTPLATCTVCGATGLPERIVEHTCTTFDTDTHPD